MDLVEQNRQLLDLVDDHEPIFGALLFAKLRWSTAERQQDVGVEKIVAPRSRQRVARERSLASLVRSDQKQRLSRCEAGEVKRPRNVVTLSMTRGNHAVDHD